MGFGGDGIRDTDVVPGWAAGSGGLPC
jgi:hypothetical protein